ncbi:NfeD family protein [Synergistaceae bacterium OttesenSCG-928-I11]|nr:NfeD family protein [Synergistaceae bacterium OttesenSCG-928-I11]
MGEWEWAHVAIGAVASVIFLVQTLGIAGESGDGDTDSGGDADIDGPDATQGLADFLSVRNFVAFFIGYGWVTLAALLSGLSRTASSTLGVGAGVVFVFVSLALIRTFLKFQEDGSLKMDRLVGKSATVYIAIGEGGRTGKVMVDTRKGRMELPARTHGPALKPGAFVRVDGVEDGVLWVSPAAEGEKK